MKCSENSDILHEIVRDTTQIRSCFSDFRVVSQTISCSISESPLHFKSFLTVGMASLFPAFFPLSHTQCYCIRLGGREGRGGVLHFTSVIFGSASRYNSFKKYLCILAKSHQNMFPLHKRENQENTFGFFGNLNSWCKKLILHMEFAIRIR